MPNQPPYTPLPLNTEDGPRMDVSASVDQSYAAADAPQTPPTRDRRAEQLDIAIRLFRHYRPEAGRG